MSAASSSASGRRLRRCLLLVVICVVFFLSFFLFYFISPLIPVALLGRWASDLSTGPASFRSGVRPVSGSSFQAGNRSSEIFSDTKWYLRNSSLLLLSWLQYCQHYWLTDYFSDFNWFLTTYWFLIDFNGHIGATTCVKHLIHGLLVLGTSLW